jgi:phytoene synthase
LSRFGASAQDIFARTHTPAFHALMQFQVERARAHYGRAFAVLPAVDRRAQRPGLMMAAIYRALLDEIERDGFRVLDRRISLAPLYKAWVAWKSSWSY